MLISSIALLVLLASPAVAGRNANGALVVHVNEELQYTPCEVPASLYCAVPAPASCDALVTQADWDMPTVYIFAAFADGASPSIGAIRFGITHNLPEGGSWVMTRCWSPCMAGATQFPDSDWPDGGGDGHSGNYVVFETPVQTPFTQVYYIVLDGIGPDQSQFFGISPYSETQPALFYDDGVPPNEDVCTQFGMMRWLQPGQNDCPQIPPASVDDAPARIMAVGPNPCVGHATFTVFLTASGAVRVQILDLQGRSIATLVDGALPAGSHEVVWNAAGASSGIYLARLTTPAGVRSTKLILLD
jgi:hypothetical protein